MLALALAAGDSGLAAGGMAALTAGGTVAALCCVSVHEMVVIVDM